MKPIKESPKPHSPADITLIVGGEEYWLESASFDEDITMDSVRFQKKEDAEEFADEYNGRVMPGGWGYTVEYPDYKEFSGEFIFQALNVPPEIKMGEPQLLVLKVEEEYKTTRYEFEDAIMVTAAGNTVEFVATDMTPVSTQTKNS